MNDIDTSAEVVERLARCLEGISRQSTIYDGLDRMNAKDAAAALRAIAAERDSLVAERVKLIEALQWFVDNDDTYEGDEPMPEHYGKTWNEINAYWTDGLNRARALLKGDCK